MVVKDRDTAMNMGSDELNPRMVSSKPIEDRMSIENHRPNLSNTLGVL